MTSPQSQTPRSRTSVIGRGPQRLLAVLSIAVVIASAVVWAGFATVTGKIKTENVFGNLENRPDRNAGSAINFLLVGSDSREGLTKEQLRKLRVGSIATAAGRRSDTLIWVHISKDRGKAALISIPRDTYATVPAYTDEDGKQHSAYATKINAAFGRGGPALTIATLESMTGVRIDHYIEVNFAGFANVVDALGGVPICTNKALKDPKSHLDLPAGRNVLDGITAVKYVRSRYLDATADLGRMKRQQQFMGAMLKQATSSGVLLNPLRLVRFINASLSTVTTDPDLKRDDLVTLALQLRSLDPSRVTMLTVPLSDLFYNNNGVTGSVLWHPKLAPELWQRIRDDKPLVEEVGTLTVAPSDIKVQILNGTDQAGFASTVASEFSKAGYVVTGTGNGENVTQTTVTYDPNQQASLETMKAALPTAKFVAVKGQGPIFTVTLAADYTKLTAVKVKTKQSPFEVQDATKSNGC